MSDERDRLEAMIPAYALGALEGDDLAYLQAALASDPVLYTQLRQYREVTAGVALSTEPVPPPAHLKELLLDRIRSSDAEPAANADSASDTSSDTTGHATPAPTDPPLPTGAIDFESLSWVDTQEGSGFMVHWLRNDPETGELAVLLKGTPGGTYIDHSHPGGEHFFVLHGSFADQHREYHAGDFYTFGPGTEHRDLHVTGDESCVLLVITGPGGITPLEGTAATQ